MIKKFSAFLVSAVMCMTSALSSCTLQTDKKKTISDESQSLANSDYKLCSTNSLGDYITNSAGQFNSNLSQLSNRINDTEYAITLLEFDKDNGKITIVSDQLLNCNMIVSFVDDENADNIISKEIAISGGKSVRTESSIDVNELPDYFLVKAQLFDSFDRAVGNEFTLNKYTKNVQEIIATDITEFEPERVVNLDDDNTTNFFVLSDDTIKAESSEEVNSLISADYDNDTYIFGNADETIFGLESGDDFYIQPDENNLIAIKVDAIEYDGDTVTLKGENNVDEILEFIKIDSVSYASDISLDETNTEIINAEEESLIPNRPEFQRKLAAPSLDVNVKPQNVEEETSASITKSIGFDRSLMAELSESLS